MIGEVNYLLLGKAQNRHKRKVKSSFLLGFTSISVVNIVKWFRKMIWLRKRERLKPYRK